MNHIAVRAIIRGRVQRVGYRDWACSTAWSLGLWGYVRNLSDGSVELMAVGPEDLVRRMLDACRSGPPTSDVSEVVEEPWLVEARMPDGAPLSGFLRVA
ncbi:MAG: acylphosphatase [Pseudomonadota bacterium]|nr:acylphosphatase [Pseudomonadota bacterium]MEE3101696.1 acylphosphatase [Pseudomonadota bacterium]